MLPKQNRVSKEKEFDAFFGLGFARKYGRNYSSQYLILKFYENRLAVSRFGFVVSNKVDNRATERNRIKRQLREAVHSELKNLKKTVDAIIVVKPAIKALKNEQIRAEVMAGLKAVRLIPPRPPKGGVA